MSILTDEEIVAINDKHYDIAFRIFESDIAIARAIEAAVLEKVGKVDVSPDSAHAAVAGVVFDFAGYLTTRPTVIPVGSTANAAPIAELVKEWAALRGLYIEDANVNDWATILTPPVPVPEVGKVDVEPVAVIDKSIPSAEIQYTMHVGDDGLPDGTELVLASALAALRAENERLIVQLAGCGVAALGNAESSKEQRAKPGDYGYSESYAEVCRAVDREIELRAENERLATEVNNIKTIAFHLGEDKLEFEDKCDELASDKATYFRLYELACIRLTEKDDEIKSLRAENKRLKDDIADLMRDERYNELEAENKALRAQLEAAQADAARLREALEKIAHNAALKRTADAARAALGDK